LAGNYNMNVFLLQEFLYDKEEENVKLMRIEA